MLRSVPMPSSRVVTVLAAAAAVVGATALPASAAFSGSAALQAAVSTVTVSPPGGVTLTLASCQAVSMQVRLSWSASATPGVDGYLSSFLFNGQPYQAQSGQSTTSVTVDITKPNAATTVSATASVSTQTAYGWTAASPRTAPVVC